MRRRIRLTGRKQLPKSAVNVTLTEIGDRPIVTLIPSHPKVFDSFPKEAKVSLKLIDNKRVEILDFGTVGKLRTSRELDARNFVAPTCQLRIADSGSKAKGLLLGSTDGWSLIAPDPKDQANSKGIIDFLPADTAPQIWKLEIRDSDYPLVKVDKRISNAGMWARNDPVFVATALPVIVRRVFDAILSEAVPEGMPWAEDWLNWSKLIAPGLTPPDDPEDTTAREDFIEHLIDTFCSQHGLDEKLLANTETGGGS
jgi:hypothetical protein